MDISNDLQIRMVSNSTKYYKESLKKQALKNQKLGKKKKKMRKQRKVIILFVFSLFIEIVQFITKQ